MKKILKLLKRNQGFTLIETLLVLMIVSTVTFITAHYGYQEHKQ